MKKIITIITAVIILFLIAFYIIYQDNLPPRTPHKVARLISGLSFSSELKVVEFQDRWNEFNGNGFSFIVIQLNDDSFDELFQEAKGKGYKELPIRENIYGPLKEISDKKSNGIYKVIIDDNVGMSFKGTLLSIDDKRLTVYFSVN